MQKLQSALDYLITYGWAVLVIGIAIGALYYLGAFGGASSLGNSCIPSTGYLCTNPILDAAGSINITLGQASGSAITISAIACTNSTQTPTSTIPVSGAVIQNGGQLTLTFQCPGAAGPIGKAFHGYLWIVYSGEGQSGLLAMVGAVNAKVATLAKVATTGSPPVNVTVCAKSENSDSLSLSLASGCGLYFCDGTNFNTEMTSVSWTQDVYSPSSSTPYASSGSQSSNTCSVTLSNSGYLNNQGLAMIGFNGVTTYNVINSPETRTGGKFVSEYSLTSTSNTVILMGCGYESCGTVKIPSSCGVTALETGGSSYSEIAFCPSQPAGNYLINSTGGDYNIMEVALLSGSSATVNDIPSLTFSNGTSISTNSVDTINATTGILGDSITLYGCSGFNCSPTNVLVTGTTSVTYQVNTLITNSYVFKACDTILNICATNTVLVSMPSSLLCAAGEDGDSLSLSVKSGCGLYFCDGTNFNTEMTSVSWTQDVYSPSSSTPYASAGSQSSNTCSVTLSNSGYLNNQGLAMIGFNGVTTYNVINSPKTFSNAFSANYVLSSTSNTLILLGCGYESCGTVKIPSSCAVTALETGGSSYSEIAFCPSQPAGNYLINSTGGDYDVVEVAKLN